MGAGTGTRRAAGAALVLWPTALLAGTLCALGGEAPAAARPFLRLAVSRCSAPALWPAPSAAPSVRRGHGSRSGQGARRPAGVLPHGADGGECDSRPLAGGGLPGLLCDVTRTLRLRGGKLRDEARMGEEEPSDDGVVAPEVHERGFADKHQRKRFRRKERAAQIADANRMRKLRSCAVYAVYLCHMCMSYAAYVCVCRVCMCMPCMYAVNVCHMCMSCMYAVYVCHMCMPCMYVAYVCLV